MVYLFESELSNNKSINFALTKIFGLGVNNANTLIKKMGLTPSFKIKHLSKEQTLQLIILVENASFKIGNDLKKFKLINKKKIIIY